MVSVAVCPLPTIRALAVWVVEGRGRYGQPVLGRRVGLTRWGVPIMNPQVPVKATKTHTTMVTPFSGVPGR